MGLRMLILLHAIISCLCLKAGPCFYGHFHPYIFQHFTEMVYSCSLVFTVCSNMCINIRFSGRVPCIPTSRIASNSQCLLHPIYLVQVLPTEYNSGSSCPQQLAVKQTQSSNVVYPKLTYHIRSNINVFHKRIS